MVKEIKWASKGSELGVQHILQYGCVRSCWRCYPIRRHRGKHKRHHSDAVILRSPVVQRLGNNGKRVLEKFTRNLFWWDRTPL